MSKLLNVVTACLVLCQLTGRAQANEEKEPSVSSEVPAVQAKIVVPPGSEALDPAVRSADEALKAARETWRDSIRSHLMSLPDSREETLLAAEAEFLRANFDQYVALMELEEASRVARREWQESHEVQITGLKEVEAANPLEGLDASRKQGRKAYRIAAQRLLELEDQAAVGIQGTPQDKQ